MKEFNAKEVWIETASALETVKPARADRKYPAYIGLDVHKETIAVAVAQAGREAPESRGEIANKPKTVAKLVERLNRGSVVRCCCSAMRPDPAVTGCIVSYWSWVTIVRWSPPR